MAKQCYNFNQIVGDYSQYLEMKDELKKEILEDFSLRKKKTSILIGSDVIECPLGNVLLNLILIAPYVRFATSLNKDMLFDESTVTQDSLERYFNRVLHYTDVNLDYIENLNYDVMRREIASVLNESADLSGKTNVLEGNSISYRDFIRMEVEDEEANNLFHPTIKEGQYHEIEEQFSNLGKRLMEYFKKHPESELYPFVASGTRN